MNQALTHELDEVLAGLDEYCRSGNTAGRRMAKSVGNPWAGGDDEAEDDRNPYPATIEGLAHFVESDGMQDLLMNDPVAFRQKYLDFIVGRQLVAKGLVSAQQVGVWAHQLTLLPPAGAPRTSGDLRKSVHHAEVIPTPWEFERTARGLEGFLHSHQMKRLKMDRPALWRQHHLDFYASLEPRPMPQEVSMKRQELELLCPDDATRSTVAKAIQNGARLTSGQSVITQNFGAAFGDPNVWLRS